VDLLSPPAGAVVTPAELLSHGIDINCPFGRREPTHPIDVRCGDQRCIRSSSGCVTVYYGYYSEARVKARALSALAMARHLTQRMAELGL
jgi:hypothetical protein